MREYIYVLKLIPRLHDEENWTDEDREIVRQHFVRLRNFCDEDKVVIAGKTEIAYKRDFGIVVFIEENDEMAEVFMNEDPAVKFGIMTGEVFPYRIALLKE